YGGVVSNANGNLGIFYGTTIGQGDRFHSMVQLDSDGNFVWDQTIVGPSYLLEGTDMAEDGSIFTAWWLGGTSAIMKASGPAPITNGVVSGRIFRNLGSNCAPTTPAQQIGLADWHILFIEGQDTLSTVTDELGNYSISADSGTYQIEFIPPNPNMGICNTADSVLTFSGNIFNVQQDFQAVALDECPELYVTAGAPYLRRCFDNQYYIDVCNYGSTNAEAVELALILDPFFTLVGTSVPPTSIQDDTLFFQIGDLNIGACVDLVVTINLSCDAVLGQAHCLEAYATPIDPCVLSPLSTWDGSSLSISEQCLLDSAQFVVTNIGSGDMASPTSYTIYTNDSEYETGTLQLLSNEQVTFNLPADGSTWNLQVE
ncbi:MAG: hypothetical protein AAFU60_17405, partial [Bacteroidota bacterium]